MKKVIIAVIAVLAAASAARAEKVPIDFDGKMESVKTHNSGTSIQQSIRSAFDLREDSPDVSPASLVFPDSCSMVDIPGNPGMGEDNREGCGVLELPGWLRPVCAEVSSGPGWAGCRVEGSVIGERYDFAGFGAGAELPSRSEIAAMAGIYSRQAALRKILDGYIGAHGGLPLDIEMMLKNDKSKILYDNNGMYVVKGQEIILLADKNLVKAAKRTDFSENKLTGVEEVGVAVFVGCVMSNSCWEAIGDAVSNATEAATSNNYNDPNDNSDHNCVSQGTC